MPNVYYTHNFESYELGAEYAAQGAARVFAVVGKHDLQIHLYTPSQLQALDDLFAKLGEAPPTVADPNVQFGLPKELLYPDTKLKDWVGAIFPTPPSWSSLALQFDQKTQPPDVSRSVAIACLLAKASAACEAARVCSIPVPEQVLLHPNQNQLWVGDVTAWQWLDAPLLALPNVHEAYRLPTIIGAKPSEQGLVAQARFALAISLFQLLCRAMPYQGRWTDKNQLAPADLYNTAHTNGWFPFAQLNVQYQSLSETAKYFNQLPVNIQEKFICAFTTPNHAPTAAAWLSALEQFTVNTTATQIEPVPAQPKPKPVNPPLPSDRPKPALKLSHALLLGAGIGVILLAVFASLLKLSRGQANPSSTVTSTLQSQTSTTGQTLEQPSLIAQETATSVVQLEVTTLVSTPNVSDTPMVGTDTATAVPAYVAPTQKPFPNQHQAMLVPAGTFQMGMGNVGAKTGPASSVYVSAYYIDRTEVTNQQFATFLNSQGSGNALRTDGNSWYYSKDAAVVQYNGSWVVTQKKEKYPVNYVSWYGAAAYCSWVGGSLPTEAQWEKAARGTDGRVFPWGDSFDATRANFCDVTCSKISGEPSDGAVVEAAVGSYPAGSSPYGVFDMAGNLSEWVSDWFGNYPDVLENNPTGAFSGRLKVTRGGSWRTPSSGTTTYDRLELGPVTVLPEVGFRCVFDAPELRVLETPYVTATSTPIPNTPTPTFDPLFTPSVTPSPTVAPSATPILPESRTDGSHAMVLIPAGTFTMGNDLGEQDERPAHTVYLDSYYMDIYEVSNEQYAVFLNEKGNQLDEDTPWYNYSPASYNRIVKEGNHWNAQVPFAQHPVNRVTWAGAQAYCQARGGRLPTEAEWEKAVRYPDDRLYPWGNQLMNSSYANVFGTRKDTAPVGSYRSGASSIGIMDLAGNVWEWIFDSYVPGFYRNSPLENPVASGHQNLRVLRGGDWGYDHTKFSIATDRYSSVAHAASDTVGFRCVWTPN